MQRSDYLQALGVTQYRRRELGVGRQVKSEAEDLSESKIRPSAVPLSDKAGGVIEKKSKATSLTSGSQPVHSHEQTFFELLVWQVPDLLILEFSAEESGLLSQKHQLANNILRAIWPETFCGTGVNQHVWPIPGLSAKPDSATDWLGSMVSGHLQQNPQCPVWLMGGIGIDLLFSDSHEDKEKLKDSKVRHSQFEADFLITSSLSEMFDNPVAKASSWQLLKSLRRP